MLFDSPVYLVFLTLVVVLYWRLGWRKQNLFLLAASYFFYGWWDWRFLAVMLTSTLVDYNFALKIAENPNRRLRKTLLISSLVMNFGFLGFFKYCNFFVDSFTHVIAFIGVHHISPFFLKIILPPGISSIRSRKCPTSSMCITVSNGRPAHLSTMPCSSASSLI